MGQYFEVDAAGVVHFRQRGTEQLILEQGTTTPVNGITGQIFWQTNTATLRVHDGSAFKSVGAWTDDGTIIATPAPSRNIQIDSGSALIPSLGFKLAPTDGLYHTGSGIGITITAVQRVLFNAYGIAAIDGTSVNPSLGFISEATGHYLVSPGVVGLSIAGVGQLATSATSFRPIVASGLTLGTSTYPFSTVFAGDGSLGAPAYTYGAATTTGHFRDATFLNTVVGGAALFRAGSNHVEVVNGSALNPAYSYINSQAAGQFLVSLNIIGWATSGLEAMRIDASQNILASGSSFSVSKSNAGGAQLIAALNTDNTVNSHAILQANVGGAAAGDAFSLYGVTGVTAWACGIDNSDGDKFKISASSFPGTNDYLIIDPVSGVVSMPNTSLAASSVLAVNGTLGAPSMAFANQTGTGAHYSAGVTGEWILGCNANRSIRMQPNTIAFYTGNTERININTSGYLVPIADNTYKLGDSGLRWSEMRATNVYTGDIHLDNGWIITEGDKVGRDKDEVLLVSPTGKKFKFLVQEVA